MTNWETKFLSNVALVPLINAGDGPTLLANGDPNNSAFLSDDPGVQPGGANSVSLPPNGWVALNGENDVYGVCAFGQNVEILVIPGGVSFFQLVTLILKTLIIIATLGNGLFVYNPTLAFGNLIASITATSETDTVGNKTPSGGFVSYANAGGTFNALSEQGNGLVWWTAASEAGPWTQQINLLKAVLSSGTPVINITGLGSVGFAFELSTQHVWLAPSNDVTGATDWSNINAYLSVAVPVFVHLLPGTYYVNQAITFGFASQHLGGDGPLSTKLQAVGTNIINVTGQLDSIEISGIQFVMPLGQNFDIFSGASAARWSVHDCRFDQNNAGNAIWNGTTGVGQTFVENKFQGNTWRASGNPRTIEAVFLSSASSSTQINGNSWRNEVFFNVNNDTAKYMVHIQNTGQLNQTNYFDNIIFEHPYGGMIWLESHTNGYINQCFGYDLPSGTATITNPLIQVSKNSTGSASARTTIVGGPRIQFGAAFAAGVGDINLDANCTDTVMEALSASGSLQLYLNGSKGVKLVGQPDGGWGIQDSPVTAVAGTGAGTGPPAPVIITGPDNQSGTITFGTGTGAMTGQMAVVTFGTPFNSTPTVLITPFNAASAGLELYTSSPSNSGFQVNAAIAPLSSQGSGVYGFRWAAIV